MTAVRVFTGPTLDHETAATILDADYRGPVTVDDLPQAIADDVAVVCIIDGAFFQQYSATPTQILACLRQGMRVYGAASAGALRAIETEAFGAIGVGSIADMFRRGFEAEDELLMSYEPDTFRPLTVPMINVRYATASARTAGVIDADDEAAINAIAKQQYFAHRTYRTIAQVGRRELGSIAVDFAEYVSHQGDDLDLKRRDATACLRRIRADVA